MYVLPQPIPPRLVTVVINDWCLCHSWLQHIYSASILSQELQLLLFKGSLASFTHSICLLPAQRLLRYFRGSLAGLTHSICLWPAQNVSFGVSDALLQALHTLSVSFLLGGDLADHVHSSVLSWFRGKELA